MSTPIPTSITDAKKRQQELEQERGAMLKNAMEMQAQFFSLRERFFVLFTDKFPTEPAQANWGMAHECARLDFIKRCEDSKAMIEKLDMKMVMPVIYGMLVGDELGSVES